MGNLTMWGMRSISSVAATGDEGLAQHVDHHGVLLPVLLGREQRQCETVVHDRIRVAARRAGERDGRKGPTAGSDEALGGGAQEGTSASGQGEYGHGSADGPGVWGTQPSQNAGDVEGSGRLDIHPSSEHHLVDTAASDGAR